MFRAPELTEVLVKTRLEDLQSSARRCHLIAGGGAPSPRRWRRTVGHGLMSVGARLAGAESTSTRPAVAVAGQAQ